MKNYYREPQKILPELIGSFHILAAWISPFLSVILTTGPAKNVLFLKFIGERLAELCVLYYGLGNIFFLLAAVFVLHAGIYIKYRLHNGDPDRAVLKNLLEYIAMNCFIAFIGFLMAAIGVDMVQFGPQ